MPRFVPRERKHKKIARAKLESTAPPDTNSNAQEIVPESREAREVRRDALREELRAAQPESKVSSKKKKRLEKYIDTKLKKDESAELLKKLEAQKVDTSLFQSSKKLGRVTESKREQLQRALREREAGIDVLGNGDEVLFEARAEVQSHSEDDEEPDDNTLEQGGVAVPHASEQPTAVFTAFGGGLKRPLDMDEDGRPIISKRKRRKTKDSKMLEIPDDTEEGSSDNDDGVEDVEEEEWEGFGTDDTNSVEEGEFSGSASLDEDQNPESDSESSESSHESIASPPEEKSERLSAFKAWADSQRNAALDFTPSANANTDDVMKAAAANFKPRAPSPDQETTLEPVSTDSTRPESALAVSRAEDIQKARLELPVVQEEQKIMERIHSRPVVVICGATGSGKTTQVPQMLLENGYASTAGTAATRRRGMIGITQPRRVAATSVATRVSHELGPEYGSKVAHQVRYDTNVRNDTMVKFMTDGILLREIQQDFVLSKYSAIVLDEAHERSVNTDLLIGMLSRIVPLRAELAKEQPDKHYPLKLIIMSATLSHGVDSFLQNQKLWGGIGGPPPVVEAEGRQFPVTVHFARKTRRDFLSEVVEKVARGHRKLPPGGMLVFLTGQQDIFTVAKKLRGKLGGSSSVNGAYGTNDDYDEDEFGLRSKTDFLEGEEDPSGSDSEAEIKLDDREDEAEFEIEESEPRVRTGAKAPLKPHILPLYAALPASQQLKVFQPSPDGHRAIILATNVAETSLTIPGIRYVFDSGRVKEKRYDTTTGVQTFEVDWVSKASAEQRKGRAGRTGPGHVWRLYSSAVYEEFFAEETVPEILRTPLESTVLQLKAMEIENVVTFPFPTPPETHQLKIAERLLANLGAITGTKGSVTDVGRELMRFPVSPRYGKMLLLAQKNHVVAHTAAIVAALAVGDLTVPEMQSSGHGVGDDEDSGSENDGSENERAQKRMEKAAQTASQQRHQAYTRAQATLSRWDDRSDAIKMLVAVALHAEKQQSGPLGTGAGAFCQDFFLREKGMEEVQMLRKQLHNLVTGEPFASKLPPPSGSEPTLLNQIVAAGFVDQVAIRTDALQGTTGFGRKPRRAIEVPYRTLLPSSDSVVQDESASPEEAEIARSVFIHPSSVLAKLSVKEMPQFIIYSYLSRAAPSVITGARAKKTRMHPLTALGPRALAALAEGTPLLHYGKPVGKIEELPRGDDGKQKRQCWLSLSLRAPGDNSSAEWPLGAWKVLQKRGTRDWEVDKVVAR